MASESTPPTVPSVKTGTSPEERSKSMLASEPHTGESVAAPSAIPGPAMSEQPPQKTRSSAAWLRGNPEERRGGISLPSTEFRGAQPSERTGGVGALPGNLSESSVALLPDERQERAEDAQATSLRQRRDTVKPSTETGGDDQQSPHQSTETSGAGAAGGNVGASTSPGVGVESQGGEPKSQEASGEQGRILGAPPSTEEQSEQKSDSAPEGDKALRQEVQGGGHKGQTAPEKKNLGGYGGDYHPAQLHPPPPGASVAEYQSPNTQQEEQPSSPTAKTGRRASITGDKKPGFMTMVKGEIKILAGMMSGDGNKVEEGKKLVHGDA